MLLRVCTSISICRKEIFTLEKCWKAKIKYDISKLASNNKLVKVVAPKMIEFVRSIFLSIGVVM